MAYRDVIVASMTMVLGLGVGGCSGPSDAPRAKQGDVQKLLAEKETVARSIKGKYEDTSLRFEGDLIVIDLILTNTSAFELSDIDISLKVSPRGIPPFKKPIRLARWASAESHRIAVPVTDDPHPNHDVCGFVTHKGDRIDLDKIYDQTGYWARTSLSGTGRSASSWVDPDGGITMSMWLSNDEAKTAYLYLLNDKGEHYPTLQKTTVQISGFVGEKEVYRSTRQIDSWPVGEKIPVPVSHLKFTEVKVRGVGRRAIVNAADLAAERQVFFIRCEWKFDW